MFTLKTEDELKLLTHEEQIAYAVEKANFEKKERESLTQKLSELETKIKTLEGKEDESLKTEIQSLKDLVQKQELSIETLGKNQTVRKMDTNKATEFIENFKKKYSEKAKDETSRDSVAFKIDNPFSQFTHVTSNVTSATYPTNGANAVIPANFFDLFGQYLGITWKPRRNFNILEYMTSFPLLGGSLNTIVEVARTGTAKFVKECEVKPYVKYEFTSKTFPVFTFAMLWKTSKKFRKHVEPVLKNFAVYIDKDFMNDLYNAIMFGQGVDFDGVLTEASAYAPIIPYDGDTNPTKLDVFLATRAMIRTLDGNPTVLFVNPNDYTEIFSKKGVDGHYMISQQNTVIAFDAISQTLRVGDSSIRIIETNNIPNGSYAMGDFEMLQYGADESAEFEQAYTGDDFERNCITNRLEMDIAVALDEVKLARIVYDTYINVISQI